MAPIDIRSSSSIPMHAPDDKMRQVDIPFDDLNPGDAPISSTMTARDIHPDAEHSDMIHTMSAITITGLPEVQSTQEDNNYVRDLGTQPEDDDDDEWWNPKAPSTPSTASSSKPAGPVKPKPKPKPNLHNKTVAL